LAKVVTPIAEKWKTPGSSGLFLRSAESNEGHDSGFYGSQNCWRGNLNQHRASSTPVEVLNRVGKNNACYLKPVWQLHFERF